MRVERRPVRILSVLLMLMATGIGAAGAGPILPGPPWPSAELVAFAEAPLADPPPAGSLTGLAGAWSAAPGFHSVGFDQLARASTVWDGALYVGGTFRLADRAAATRVAKWTAAGGWEGVGAGVDGEVWCLAVFDDGGGEALYAGGIFTHAGGLPASYIAKWDGAVWSAVGGGMGSAVIALAVYDDGGGPALYAGGEFLSAGGVPANRIAKWDGSTWSALGSGLDAGLRALHVWNDGSGPALYAGGLQTTAGGLPASRIAKWNGSSWSALGAGLDGNVQTITSFGGGSVLYAGGNFTTAGGAAASRVAQWNGSSWSPLGAGFDALVLSLSSFDDGGGEQLYASGSFSSSGATATQRVARWNGSSWLPLGGNTIDGSPSFFVSRLLPFDAGSGAKLIAVGSFDKLGEAASAHVAGWNGAAWTGITDGSGRGVAGWTAALGIHDDGGGAALYAGGDFRAAGGVAAAHVAKWKGSQWEPLGSGVNRRVNAFETFDDGSGEALFVGGEFSVAGGSPASLIAKWDGSTWSALGSGLFSGRVSDLEVFDDGSGSALYAGGQFTVAGGAGASNVARWDGSAWSAVGPGLNDWVMSLQVFDAGDGPALYAGGPFRTDLGGSVSWFARWDGADWVPVPGAPNSYIFQMKVFDDGSGPKLAAYGGFTEAGGLPANGLATWDGVLWTPLGLDFTATGIGIFDDGGGASLYAMGRFADTPAGSQVFAKWNGSAWVAQGVAIDSTLATRLQAFDDGSGNALFLGGTFSQAGGQPSSYIAKLRPTPQLSMPPSTPVAEGGDALVPVSLDPGGNSLAAVAFSIDYDHVCLDPDVNDDNALDSIVWNVPAGFTTLVNFNPLDTDGEIDVTIADLSPPFAALPAGELLRIRYRAVCSLATTPIDAAVAFSASPAPSFGDLEANDVTGASQGGVVRILPGPRGDCNGNAVLAVADLSAIALEIFDADGTFWLDAPGSTYAGSPVGCDANASTTILAADVTCANLLLFGGACAPPLAELAAIAPLLEVSSSFDSGKVWLRGRLDRNGAAVGSLAYSLDLDPGVFNLASIDANNDGQPDHLRFPSGMPSLAFVGFSAADTDGELDILLADLAQQPLPEGVLVEVGIPAAAAQSRGFDLGRDPAPSFGSVDGGDLPGIAVVGRLLFTDGFETGNTAGWSLTLP